MNEAFRPKVLAHWPGRNMCSGNVYDKNNICQTLMACLGTGGNNQPLIHLEDKNMAEEKTMEGGKYEKTISCEVLCILRKAIGEKGFSEWAFRGICLFLQKEVLQQRMYAKGVFEDWQKRTELEQFSYYSQKDEWLDITEEKMRGLWEDWQIGCSPYRSQFSEQQLRQLDDFMQKLPHEDSQSETCLQDLWKACEGIGILQQALHQVQEIRKSFINEQRTRPRYRIRKLTDLECFRLMNFSDEDWKKAAAVNSRSQLYRQAGNSIVVAVLCAIFSQLGIQGHKRWNEMTVEERRALVYKGTILEKSQC
ncbi:MAG: DNA cytosine methyltransferase [Treponema sp.]|nr:DNA cytosine methyltransferase [Treponema sp.]